MPKDDLPIFGPFGEFDFSKIDKIISDAKDAGVRATQAEEQFSSMVKDKMEEMVKSAKLLAEQNKELQERVRQLEQENNRLKAKKEKTGKW